MQEFRETIFLSTRTEASLWIHKKSGLRGAKTDLIFQKIETISVLAYGNPILFV